MTPRRSAAAPTGSAPFDGAAAGLGGAEAGEGLLCRAALAILLMCVAARPFVPEFSFRVSAVKTVRLADGSADFRGSRVDPGEVSRVVLAAALLAAVVLWMLGSARQGVIAIRHGWLGGVILAFAILSGLSALGAADKRAAWTSWFEQVSLLAAGFVTAQLASRARARDLIVIVLAATGLALAAKGLWQVFVEFPANAGYYEMYGEDAIRRAGQSPGTPEAEMFRKRLLADTPHGFHGLSNLYGSMLLVPAFAAAAAAAQKLWAARARMAAAPDRRKPGEIDLGMLAGAVTAAAAGVIAVVLVLTRSRGAVLAGGLAVVAAVVVVLARRSLARRWRACVLTATALLILGVAGVVGYGLARDRLPSRTMTFRWYYWTASTRIFRERPVLGVGGGNFANAYLRHRRVEGEEGIKTPHNVAVHALTQYGLPGGLCLLAAIAYVLVAATRPRGASALAPTAGPSDSDARHGRRPLAMMAVVVAAVAAGRWVFEGADAEAALVLQNVLLPSAVMAAALALVWWRGDIALSDGDMAPAARIMLVGGLAAFAAHNLVTYSFWLPGPALVFWMAAGVCLAAVGPVGAVRIARGRWPVAIASAVLLVVVTVWLGRPVLRRDAVSRRVVAGLLAGDLAGPAALADAMAAADPLDGRSAADAAKVLREAAARAAGGSERRASRDRAYRFAAEAIRREPGNGGYHRLAGGVLWAMPNPAGPNGPDEALKHIARAVEHNPMNARWRIEYARMLLTAGRASECIEQIRRARYIDEHLPRAGRPNGSVMQLTPAELKELAQVEAAAKAGQLDPAPKR